MHDSNQPLMDGTLIRPFEQDMMEELLIAIVGLISIDNDIARNIKEDEIGVVTFDWLESLSILRKKSYARVFDVRGRVCLVSTGIFPVPSLVLLLLGSPSLAFCATSLSLSCFLDILRISRG